MLQSITPNIDSQSVKNQQVSNNESILVTAISLLVLTYTQTYPDMQGYF